jgi:hypothetical protein
MNVAIKHCDNGRLLSEATAEELNAVTGGANYTFWNNGTGVIFWSTGVSLVTADGKGGAFFPKDGSKPTTWGSLK